LISDRKKSYSLSIEHRFWVCDIMPPPTISGLPDTERVVSALTDHFGVDGSILMSLGVLMPQNPEERDDLHRSPDASVILPTFTSYTANAPFSWLATIEKALLRPPLLLALYLLDLDQCEVVSVEQNEENNETDSIDVDQYIMSRMTAAATESSPAAVAALQIWVVDLVESVSCWL